jgi:hypothetical protein
MGVCSLSVTVQASQLKFIIESMGIEPTRASLLISFYATGVIVGRLSCGAALRDDHPPFLLCRDRCIFDQPEAQRKHRLITLDVKTSIKPN